MVRCFHDQSGRCNRMQYPFERGHGAGFKVGSFHNGSIHSLHPVQLTLRPSSCIKQSRLLQKADCTFNGIQRRASPRKDAIAGLERVGQTSGLRRRHTPGTGASMGKDEKTGAGQLRRRFRACRYVGSFMRSRSDRTNPRPVTQSSKLSESFLNRGGSSGDGPSAICATIP